MSARRLLLPEPVGDAELAAVAGASGWTLDSVRPTKDSWERVWVTPDKKTYISYVEDHNLGIRYISVEGENAAEIVDSLRTKIPVVTRQELLDVMRTASSREQKTGTVYYVGAFADEAFDPELFDYFRRLLNDPDTEVRRAAIYATLYPAWREFAPHLENIRANDSDVSLRHLAHVTLDSLEKNNWNKAN